MFYFSFSGSAYFDKDGNRRGYTFEDPKEMEILIREKMRKITQKEDSMKMERIENVLNLMTTTITGKIATKKSK